MKKSIFKFLFSIKFYGPVFITLGAIILYKILNNILNNTTVRGRNELEKKRRNTLIILFDNIIKYIIAIVAILMILDIFGFNTTSIVAGLGAMGLLIGLALQDALKDIIAGINIVMDNYYVVGDTIKYKDFTGIVISFGLKTTKIKSESGDVLIVTNRNIDAIVNLSQKQSINYFDLVIDTNVNSTDVISIIDEIINEVITKDKSVDKNDSKYLGIEKVTGSNTTYLFQIKCIQGKEKEIRREVYKLIKEKFTTNEIKLAG